MRDDADLLNRHEKRDYGISIRIASFSDEINSLHNEVMAEKKDSLLGQAVVRKVGAKCAIKDANRTEC